MKDFSFQGEITLANRTADGKRGAGRDVGDAPEFTVKLSEDSSARNESRSGLRLPSATLRKGKTATFTLVLNYGNADNFALGLYGVKVVRAAGTVTGEELPDDIEAGSVVVLDHPMVSNVVITDSAEAPKTLDGTNFSVRRAASGVLDIIDVTGLTLPLKVAYGYGAGIDLSVFKAQPPEKWIVCDGVNTVDNNRMRSQFYRAQFDPIDELALINDDWGQISLSGSLLCDELNADDSDLGGFGKIELPAES